MTEIEKMFENAGIKGEWRDYRTKNGKIYEGKNPKNRNIRLCKPRFTAEKQLELIKWLIRNKRLFIRKADYSSNYYMDVAYNRDNGVDNPKFESCLASLINGIWQSLITQEKEEIRRILNE